MKATPRVTAARRHAVSMRTASAIDVAIGFSHSTCFPASAARTTCSAWKAFGEATKTPSTRESLKRPPSRLYAGRAWGLWAKASAPA